MQVYPKDPGSGRWGKAPAQHFFLCPPEEPTGITLPHLGHVHLTPVRDLRKPTDIERPLPTWRSSWRSRNFLPAWSPVRLLGSAQWRQRAC